MEIKICVSGCMCSGFVLSLVMIGFGVVDGTGWYLVRVWWQLVYKPFLKPTKCVSKVDCKCLESELEV